MKRKLVQIFLAALCVAELSACTAGGGAASGESGSSSVVNETESAQQLGDTPQTGVADGSQSINESSETASDENETGQQTEESGEPFSLSEVDPVYYDKEKASAIYLLYDESVSDRLYLVDGQGTQVANLDYDGFVEYIRNEGYSRFNNAWLEGQASGILFFSLYGEDNICRIYAVKTKTADVCKLMDLEEDERLSTVDVFEGNILITTTSNNYSEVKEYLFEKDEVKFRYTSKKHNLKSFCEAAKGYFITSTAPGSVQEQGAGSFTRAFRETGFVIGTNGSEIVRITEKGDKEKIEGISGDTIVARAYDRYGLVYEVFTEDNQNSTLYLYDFQTKKASPVEDAEGKPQFLCYEDGVLYYSVELSEEYGKSDIAVYSRKVGAAAEFVYETENEPGSGLTSAIQGFHVINGKIFQLKLSDGEIGWMRLKSGGEDPVFAGLELPVSTVSFMEIGSVHYRSKTQRCAKCGTHLIEMYHEYFELDEILSPHADKINSALRNEGIMEEDFATTLSVSEEECENHRESANRYCETFDTYVKDAKILGGLYLAVDMSGYWYGGGAHGMPSREQYLFELATGERLGIKDFYAGTENEFRKLVAEKTVQDFKSYAEGMSPYFSSDADKIYQDAYNASGFEKSHVEFGETGVTIVYDPYVMGPYAAGFITITIPYEDILGKSLTE